VPLIDPSILDCALYVYPSEGAAQQGVSAGGSGFLVGIPAPLADWWHIYAVTNKHVLDGGHHVLRINTKNGGFDTITTTPDAWTTLPDDDVAVLPLEVADKFHVNFIPAEMFMPEHNQGTKELGIGDDAVLIGRLITHEGRQRNKPIARFGSIAMLADADEPIRISEDKAQVGYLIDCRSLSGASGSAVLGFRVPHRGNMMMIGASLPVLLGIDCAHLPFWTPVCEKRDRRAALPDMWAESNSGIAVVVPAWRIQAALDQGHLVDERRREDEQIVRDHGTSVTEPTVDPSDSNPSNRSAESPASDSATRRSLGGEGGEGKGQEKG